jgi:hypothetical protein
MNIERAILVGFLGNYLINTVVAGLVSLVPATQGGGFLTPQYITFVVVSAVVAFILTWWYGARGLQGGALFGVTGFLVAIVTAFISGISGVLAQTGSLSSVGNILPNFWPFIWNWSTLVLLCYWVIPAALEGWWLGGKDAPMQKPSMMGGM